MAKYYVDFVGLNTFIYEPVGWNPEDQYSLADQQGRESYFHPAATLNFEVAQNHIGWGDFAAGSVAYNKNYSFPHDLPNTASFFPALMLHRNGPYGHPMWKQTRGGENPLIRKQRKENVMTITREIDIAQGFGGIQLRERQISAFSEVPVTSKYKPISIAAGSIQGNQLQRFKIKASYGNNIVGFNNDLLNRVYDINESESNEFNSIKKMYLRGGLDRDSSPIDSFEHFGYRETVFPQRLYTYKDFKRQRTTFIFPWKDDRAKRNSNGAVATGFDLSAKQSIWPLDVDDGWATKYSLGPRLSNASSDLSFGKDYSQETNPGILWQRKSSFVKDAWTIRAAGLLSTHVSAGPLYSRRHMLLDSASVVSPGGMNIEGINFNLGSKQYPHISPDNIPSGEAAWEANSENKGPFYDSYDKYIAEPRGKYKDYGIVPEFRISNHVEAYESIGLTEQNLRILELTGGLKNQTGSAESGFYKVFANTDFMEHFEFIRKEHDEFVDPSRIVLKCKAMKKFLPYDGFYPVQRSSDVAKQFYSSYSGSVAFSGAAGLLSDGAGPYAIQNLIAPLFAPGVLYNSIKSGVAVDYPIFTGSALTSGSSSGFAGGISCPDGAALRENFVFNLRDGVATNRGEKRFSKRIPFLALLEPERYLASEQLVTMEPHPSGNFSGSCMWDGQGDRLYKKMIHNYLSEIPNFFMKGKGLTAIKSKKSSNPKVGNARKNKVYMMRVKMYKTMEGDTNHEYFHPNDPSGRPRFVELPQVPSSSGARETFTMYSRPTAFGPPSIFRSIGVSGYGSQVQLAQDSRKGWNFPYTPPYYHGQAWADIKFIATETKKYSLTEIMNKSEVFYYRYIDPFQLNVPSLSAASTNRVQERQGMTRTANGQFLQLSASLNLFGKGAIENIVTPRGDEQSTIVKTQENEDHNWIIHPWFESPMLNFNHLSSSTSVTVALNGSQSVPRGMWHQKGRLETGKNAGIYMQVTDIPNQHIELIYSGSAQGTFAGMNVDLTGSLAYLCGFDTSPVKMGRVAETTTVREAVVAIPFIEEAGSRQFFKLDNQTWEVAQARSTGRNPTALFTAGYPTDIPSTIQEMANKMSRYVFPPSMDFYNNFRNIDPFAMYIFEFKHTFTKQDLANMWQGLLPKIGLEHSEAVSSVGHPLLEEQLLGEDGKIPDKLKWMVFKVKQRAKTNYNAILAAAETPNGAAGFGGSAGSMGQQTMDPDDVAPFGSNSEDAVPPAALEGVNYNWPYDFFSLVELVKLDVGVNFSEDEGPREEKVIKPKLSAKLLTTAPEQSRAIPVSFQIDRSQPDIPDEIE